MMILNGKQLAEEIKGEITLSFARRSRKPRLDIVYAGNDPAIESFMKIKIRAGEEVGAETIIHRFSGDVPENKLLREIKALAHEKKSDGIIIQLPLPKGMDTREILNAVPVEKDADMLSEKSFQLFVDGKTTLIPPVARAIMEILQRNGVSVSEKNVVVLGRGILVGKPIAVCLKKERANITSLNSTTGDPTPYLLQADIIISGVGKPHMIKPEMIKVGAVLIDAGTSGKDGKIFGDADPLCASQCSLFTPVPGGVGPVMIAMLFKNLDELSSLSSSQK